jgi:hypothetical protein
MQLSPSSRPDSDTTANVRHRRLGIVTQRKVFRRPRRIRCSGCYRLAPSQGDPSNCRVSRCNGGSSIGFIIQTGQPAPVRGVLGCYAAPAPARSIGKPWASIGYMRKRKRDLTTISAVALREKRPVPVPERMRLFLRSYPHGSHPALWGLELGESGHKIPVKLA